MQCEPELSQEIERFYHCDGRSRGGTLVCRNSFLQELCDLQHCWRLVEEGEQPEERGAYDLLMRMRADVLWETRVELQRPIRKRSLFVPWMEANGGINDHVAAGGRAAMASFFRRARYLNDSAVWQHPLSRGPSIASLRQRYVAQVKGAKRPRISSEMFLDAVMRHDGMKVQQLESWPYCLHSHKALSDQHGVYGCIARARGRTRCKALICMNNSPKYWCNCYNHSCDGIQGRGRMKLGPFEDGTVRVQLTRDAHCVDVAGTQLLSTAGEGGNCLWPRSDYTRYQHAFVARDDACKVKWVGDARVMNNGSSLITPDFVWKQAARGKRDFLTSVTWQALLEALKTRGADFSTVLREEGKQTKKAIAFFMIKRATNSSTTDVAVRTDRRRFVA